MYQFSFEKLEAWKCSQILVEMIYADTKEFPKNEMNGIVSQIRRSSVSVSTNLAEGSGKQSFKEKNRFISISYGSLMETMNLVILSNTLKYISNERMLAYRSEISKLSFMLNKLSKYFKSQSPL